MNKYQFVKSYPAEQQQNFDTNHKVKGVYDLNIAIEKSH